MKACSKCDELKDESDYYANDNTCKECRKAKVRANRAEKLEYYREYDRVRANKPKRVKARREYAKTEAGKLATIRAKAAYAERNPVKRKAHSAVSNALRDGKLAKEPCEVCGTTKNVQAHHDDYSKPLDIRWLCVKDHNEHHKNEREQKRRSAA